MARSRKSKLKSLVGSGLLAKFLWVLVPVFVLLALPGLNAMVSYELRGDHDSLAARIGALAARTSIALARHDVIDNRQLGLDLLAPLASDRAFECAELRVAETAPPFIALPQGLGCRGNDGAHALVLPIREKGGMTLMVRFSNAEIAASQEQRRNIVFAVVIVSIVCSVFAATIGFRFIVGGPLAAFSAAIRKSVETGQRTKVDIEREDELGQVIAAFDDMQDRDERREDEMKRTYEALAASESELRHLNEELEVRVADRTSELEAEKSKAQADRDYLGAVLETVADAIVATDDRGRIRSVNRAAEHLFGYRAEEIVGSSIARLIPAQVGRLPIASMVQAQSEGRVRIGDNTLESRGRKRDGLEFPLEITISEMHYGGRHIFISVLRDVTERQENQRRLIEAKEEAETANRSKSLFLANMSHELRTPLNAVLGFSEAMQQEIMGPLGNERYEQYVNDIHSSGEHLLHLINSVLDFSKIEAGAESLKERDISVADLVEECVRMIGHRCEVSNLTLSVDTDGAPPAVRADHTKLKQILFNLLSNAVKFTSAGGQIALTAHVNTASQLEFVVADNGIGMDEEQIPLALSRFGQVENSFSRRYEGTGLGLPLAKALAELHGGSLYLESEKDVGTTVTVVLPAERIVGRYGDDGNRLVRAGGYS